MEQKSCTDCIYFREYYVKQKTRYYKTSRGFCSNTKPSGHKRKTDKICEFYNQRDTKQEKDEQLNCVTKQLSVIVKRLGELAEIFINEN